MSACLHARMSVYTCVRVCVFACGVFACVCELERKFSVKRKDGVPSSSLILLPAFMNNLTQGIVSFSTWVLVARLAD